ncbi:MAG: hypothetical protein K1X78_09220 [Verrucomicrobiaceae bacterium]|nr:hypothetical protein [Verrucomicrobiaceae bacterium]
MILIFGAVLPAEEKAHPPKAGERGTITIPKSPVQSEAEQLKLRLHALENPPAYDVSREVFEVIVPPKYKPADPHGLFIWISSGNSPAIPKEWEAMLVAKKLIFVGARNSGNPRNLFDRMRMAIDANVHLRTLYQIDGRRVYVSGFSGGSRVASMLGVCYAEMFSGTICCMGVNFYTDVVGDDGKTYGLNYIPDDEVAALAKKFCRYALFAGEKDFNRPNTRAAYEQGFKKEGFTNVKLFDVPGIGHQPPPADWLGKAIDYLDEGKPAGNTGRQ